MGRRSKNYGRMQGQVQVGMKKGRMDKGCGGQMGQKGKVHGGVEENDVWCAFFQEKRGKVMLSASGTGKNVAFCGQRHFARYNTQNGISSGIYREEYDIILF